MLYKRVRKSVKRTRRACLKTLLRLAAAIRIVCSSALVSKPATNPYALKDRPVIFISGDAATRPGYTYRVKRYAEAFRLLGHTVVCLTRDEIQSNTSIILSARIIIIWRADWSVDISAVVASARLRGTIVIFDLDDLLVCPELTLPEIMDEIRFENRDVNAVKQYHNAMRRTMKNSDICTASTHELAWHMRKNDLHRRPVYVRPNGYDAESYQVSRVHARIKKASTDDIIRIGYASGTRTHQKDFGVCVNAVSECLRQYPHTRLVLFSSNNMPTLDTDEFPELDGLEDQIEWRPIVKIDELPKEIARFDINLAPLLTGNPFCEAKSELKFFEAAICDVPTIASPTGPFRRAIDNGLNGFLAMTKEDWFSRLDMLIRDSAKRKSVGREAHRSVLWSFGPMRRIELCHLILKQIDTGRDRAYAFRDEMMEFSCPRPAIRVPEHEILFEYDKKLPSSVSIIITLHNYERYIEEALESARLQTLDDIELIIVDDDSTDASLDRTYSWLEKNSKRFNRAVLARNLSNQGAGLTRNTAIDIADSLYYMALDADNKLLPECCTYCLHAIQESGMAFAYPVIKKFGMDDALISDKGYHPALLIPGNYIDAMAMISKEAWAMVGGYSSQCASWDDFDFWCKLADHGLCGTHVNRILAEYRVHDKSESYTTSRIKEYLESRANFLEQSYPWLSIQRSGRTGHHRS